MSYLLPGNGVIFPQNHQILVDSREITASIKRSNNLKTVGDKQNISMQHEYEVKVALSDSDNMNYI